MCVCVCEYVCVCMCWGGYVCIFFNSWYSASKQSLLWLAFIDTSVDTLLPEESLKIAEVIVN